MGEVIPFRPQTTRRKADAVREAFKRDPRAFDRHRVALAEKLHDLLAEAEREAPGARRAFLKALYPDQKDPAKRLDELALARGASEARKGRIRKKAQVHLQAAEALAACLRLSEEEVIVDLFSVVRLDEPGFAAPDPVQLDLQQEFWDRWMDMNEAILKDLGPRLQRAFQLQMRFRTPGFGPLERFAIAWDEPLPSELSDEPEASAQLALVRSLPSLFLGQVTGPSLDGAGRSTRGDDGTEVTATGWGRVWFRFYWCIAPFGERQQPRPAIKVVAVRQFGAAAWPNDGSDGTDAASGQTGQATASTWRDAIEPLAEWDRPWDEDGLVGALRHHTRSCDVLCWNAYGTDGMADCRLEARWNEAAWTLARRFLALEQPVPEDWQGRVTCLRQPDHLWRDVLSLPDGSDTDWVGPDPDKRIFTLPPKPPDTDDPESDASSAADDAWCDLVFERDDAEAAERYRFWSWNGKTLRAFPDARFVVPAPDAEPPNAHATEKVRVTPMGEKLERSLLELPHAEKPHVELRRRVEAFIKQAEADADAVLRDWRKALDAVARIGREPR